MKKYFIGTLALFSLLLVCKAQIPLPSSVTEIGPGVYLSIYELEGPLRVYVIEADLSNKELKIDVGIANDRIAHGGELTSDFVSRKQLNDGLILAAVNGDFFGGSPHQAENCMVVGGDYAKGVKLNRTLFGINSDNVPFIGGVKFSGYIAIGEDTVQIDALNKFPEGDEIILLNYFRGPYVEIPDDLAAVKLFTTARQMIYEDIPYTVERITGTENLFHVEENELFVAGRKDQILTLYERLEGQRVSVNMSAVPIIEDVYSLIGGLPRLVTDGKRPDDYQGKEGMNSLRFIDKNPRTAVGYNRDQSRLFIVAADGRQPGYSIGMTLYELADFMIGLGCYQALNLDGGGSTSMTVRDELVNSPSDKTGERPVHNFLYLSLGSNPGSILGGFEVHPDSLILRKGEKGIIKTESSDKWGYELPLMGDSLFIYSSVPNLEATMEFIAAGDTVGGYVYFEYFGRRDSVLVSVY